MFKVVAFIVTQKGQVKELRFAKNEEAKALAVARDSSKSCKKVTLSAVLTTGKCEQFGGIGTGRKFRLTGSNKLSCAIGKTGRRRENPCLTITISTCCPEWRYADPPRS